MVLLLQASNAPVYHQSIFRFGITVEVVLAADGLLSPFPVMRRIIGVLLSQGHPKLLLLYLTIFIIAHMTAHPGPVMQIFQCYRYVYTATTTSNNVCILQRKEHMLFYCTFSYFGGEHGLVFRTVHKLLTA